MIANLGTKYKTKVLSKFEILYTVLNERLCEYMVNLMTKSVEVRDSVCDKKLLTLPIHVDLGCIYVPKHVTLDCE